MAEDLIGSRAELLLKSLVQSYIRDGQPVGSKSLLQESGLLVSPATVRNVMAELEERGYLISPHTSAGRIPTTQGYRLFVDSLLTMQPMDKTDVRNLELELDPDKSVRELVETASHFLSEISSQAGLVTVPRPGQFALRQVEFLPLSGDRVLVILVVNDREVQNRIIHIDKPYSALELQQLTQMLNQRFAGQSLEQVRSGIVTAMHDDKASIDNQMQAMLDLASKAFEGSGAEGDPDYIVAGESQLINGASPGEMEQLQGLFSAFQQKQDILDLVDRSIKADGVQIFIGDEAGYELLDDFSVVTAPYNAGGDKVGVLGVIGPTRMAYERVIPIVDVTARMLSLAMNKS